MNRLDESKQRPHGLPGSPTEAVEAAKSVDDLMSHPGWAVFASAVEWEEKAQLKVAMRPDAVHNDAAKYADFMGFLKGLRKLPEIAAEIVKEGQKISGAIADAEARAKQQIAGTG